MSYQSYSIKRNQSHVDEDIYRKCLSTAGASNDVGGWICIEMIHSSDEERHKALAEFFCFLRYEPDELGGIT